MKKRHLTPKQLQLLILMLDGHSDRTLAATLNVSPSTINSKWRALKRGLNKDAYIVLDDIRLRMNGTLF